MASIIKDWISNFLLGDWDFTGKNDVADFLTFICIVILLFFVVKSIKWFLNLFSHKYIL